MVSSGAIAHTGLSRVTVRMSARMVTTPISRTVSQRTPADTGSGAAWVCTTTEESRPSCHSWEGGDPSRPRPRAADRPSPMPTATTTRSCTRWITQGASRSRRPAADRASTTRIVSPAIHQ
jgi:hypothetical protein